MKHQTLKVSFSDGAYYRYGGNYKNFSMAWQYSWLGKPNQPCAACWTSVSNLALGGTNEPRNRYDPALLLLHCLEIAVWGQAGFWLQILPGRYTAYYFSIMNYATVVWGDVGAPRH